MPKLIEPSLVMRSGEVCRIKSGKFKWVKERGFGAESDRQHETIVLKDSAGHLGYRVRRCFKDERTGSWVVVPRPIFWDGWEVQTPGFSRIGPFNRRVDAKRFAEGL